MSNSLSTALWPIMHMLQASETEDVAIQEPGVVWWLHHGSWHRVEAAAMTYARCHAIAVMAAAQTRQQINPRNPIIDTDLLGNLRLIAVMPPAVRPGTMSLTFRRGDMAIDELSEVPKMFGTARWNKWEGRRERQQQRDGALLERFDTADLEGFLRGVAETRQTGMFVAATGAGKTRLGKAVAGAIPMHERIITIEDAAEMVIRQENHVRLFYATSGVGATQAQLLKATLRMRPDRIMLAEMRDHESATVFLSEIMAGHPGSYSTLHSRNPPEAARRLFNLLSGGGSDSEATIEQLTSAIDFIIPIENDGGVRDLGEIWFRPDAQRRGTGFRDLLREI
jgi:type IV secretion system protein VirB11